YECDGALSDGCAGSGDGDGDGRLRWQRAGRVRGGTDGRGMQSGDYPDVDGDGRVREYGGARADRDGGGWLEQLHPFAVQRAADCGRAHDLVQRGGATECDAGDDPADERERTV